MFDIGFWELILIGLVALVVIGPQRLPEVARTAGLWIGRFKRMAGSVKADIDREIKTEELRRILEEQSRSRPMETILGEETNALLELERETRDSLRAGRSSVATDPAADGAGGTPEPSSSLSGAIQPAQAPSRTPGQAPSAGEAQLGSKA